MVVCLVSLMSGSLVFLLGKIFELWVGQCMVMCECVR